MPKKHTHGPIPKGNQQKHAVDPRKLEVDEEDQGLAQPDAEGRSMAVDDVADEKGRIHPPENNKKEA